MKKVLKAILWIYCVIVTLLSLLLLVVPSTSTYITSGVNLIIVALVYFKFLRKKKDKMPPPANSVQNESTGNQSESSRYFAPVPIASSTVVESNVPKVPTSNDIEQRIREEIAKNPNISTEELQDKIIKEGKEKITRRVLQNVTIKVQGSDSGETRSTTSFKSLGIVPDSSLTYSKVRKITKDFVVLDLETTGLSNSRDEIIQVAVVKYVNFEKVGEFETLVKPKISIPYEATEINGITNQDVKDAPTIQTVLPKILDFIGDNTIVAHNASFDMKFLLSAMYNHDFEHRKFRVIDTLSLARKYIDFTKNHKLATLKSFLKLNHLNSHDALHDCYVTAELYKYCYNESISKENS